MCLQMKTLSADVIRKHLLQGAQLRRAQDRCRVLDDPRTFLLIDLELGRANRGQRHVGTRVLQVRLIGGDLAVAT
jgi:hypothetical protein